MDSDQFPTFGNHQFQEDFAQALAPDTDVPISSIGRAGHQPRKRVIYRSPLGDDH